MYNLKEKNKWINYANNSTEEYYHETVNNVPIDIENHLSSVKNIRVMIMDTMNRFVKKISRKKMINGINSVQKIKDNIKKNGPSDSDMNHNNTLSSQIKPKVKKKKKIMFSQDTYTL